MCVCSARSRKRIEQSVSKAFFILVRFQPIWHRKTEFMAKLSLASLTSELEPLIFIEGERERDLLFIN